MVESLPRLAAFVAVAEELHFGRAAKRLDISQPSLSARIRRLEAEFGVTLLSRTSRSVSLTPAGEAVLERSRTILAEADALARIVAVHRDLESTSLRLGFTGSAASEMLPEVLQRLRRRWPDLQVTLRELTELRYQLLWSGDLDAVFGRLVPEEGPDLEVTVLREESRVVALWDGHPLAGRQSVRMAELADDGFITQPEAVNPAYRESWLAEQRAHGLQGRITGEASSLQEFLNLTATGRGVCLAPAAAARFNPWPGITYVRVEDAQPSVVSVVRRRDALDPRTDALVRAAEHVAAQHS